MARLASVRQMGLASAVFCKDCAMGTDDLQKTILLLLCERAGGMPWIARHP